MNLILFYHSLLGMGDPPELIPAAADIVIEQMDALKSSGLLDACSEFHVGVNGGRDAFNVSRILIPAKANIVCHPIECKNELRTILMVEAWLKSNSHESFVLYHHSKGATRPRGDYVRTRWRQCMTKHLVKNWRQCVQDLESVESVGCHFMSPPKTPATQYIWAGNFWFSRASYLRTLPSIMLRDRIKLSGIDSPDSRFEGEVWHFNGSRLPTLRDYHGPGWDPSMVHTCTP